MKQRIIDREHGLHVIAAAVLVALGSSHAAAQQPSQQGADRPQTQQSQQSQQSQPGVQSPSERQAQDPASQPAGQDSASQRAGQDSASERAGQDSASQRQAQDPAAEQESDTRSAAASADSAGGAGQLDQIAEEHDDLSSFIEAVKAAGMEESLTGGTEYTVFAPTNDALESMSGMSLEELMREENREQLISLLRAHIVADDVDENMARTLEQAQTIDGGTIDISASGDEIQVGDASVVETGIQEGSLRVYAIDQVLEPTALARADSPAGASESESQLDTGSERESESQLETESERESGSQLERDDPFGSENRPGAQQPGAQPGQPGAQPGAQQPGAQSPSSTPRPGAPQPQPQPGQERPGASQQN